MKITFKDTLRKENILLYLLVVIGIAGAVTALFVPSMADFWWALAAALMSVDALFLNTVLMKEREEAEVLKARRNELLDENIRLLNEKADLQLDNERLYEKVGLMREVNLKVQSDYDTLYAGHEKLLQSLPEEQKPKPEPKKTASKKGKKRIQDIKETVQHVRKDQREYTEQDKARIREELKSAGIVKDTE